MQIGLLSDTHSFLDEAVLTYFANCDEVWHAGDLGSLDVLNRLKQFKPLRAVYGNVDDEAVRAEVPEELEWQVEGLSIYMTHIGGRPGRYEPKVKRQLVAKRPNIFICGHSHVLRVENDAALGLTYLNPGACGHQGWHTRRTVLLFTLAEGAMTKAEIIDLGPRGSSRSRGGEVPK